MKKLSIHIILILAVQFGFSQIVTNVQLDTNSIVIGQQTNLTLSIDYNVDGGAVKINFPVINDTLTKQVEVVKKSVLDTLIPDSEEPTLFRQTQELTVTSFDSGYYVIPPFSFVVNDDTILSEPTLLTVSSFPVDTTQAIFDIKGPIAEPFSIADWLQQNWWWLLLIVIIAIVVFYLIKYFKNKPVNQIIEKPKPKIPAHIPALKKLEEIKKLKLWQHEKTKEHHSQISETLRAYIEDRFGTIALEQTTYEIAYSLKLKDISPDRLEQLIEVLKLADLVKFAKEKPLPNENEDSLTKAFEFVNATKKQPIENTDV